MSEPTPTVFVSYSHKDKKHLDELLPFLEVLELDEEIDLWHDRKIGGGENWYTEIDDRMRQARVGILLVTANFLSSRFCRFEEIPILLQRRAKGELALLPVIVKQCPWQGQRWLKRLQLPLGAKPLNRYSGPLRDEQLTKLAEEVRRIVVVGVTPPKLTLPTWPVERYNLHRLPETGSLLFGRRKELKLLDAAWEDGKTNVVVFTAGGGVGKSTLCRVWCEILAEESWRGAHRAYAWSFYSQGTGRQSSADSFISAAFRWFGEEPGDLSPWDRGARLAELVSRERMLLVLDGVEPLQSPSEVDRGVLRDPALKTLLEDLAKQNPGLCLVSTREPMTDLKEFTKPAVLQHDLEHVSLLAGRALLRVAGVCGEDEELEAAVEALGGHALAVNLLATYIADTEGRHIGTIQDLPEPDPAYDRDAHPRRVIEAWAKRLGESPELDILNQLGLFDRTASGPELKALREPPAVVGLNRELRAGNYEEAVERLRSVRLLSGASEHEPHNVDAHPLVRQHFGERLHATLRMAWTAGHDRLYEHLATTTEHRPDTLGGLMPLYAAAAHGCAAGRHQEALDEVYFQRISRGSEAFVTQRLGGFGADLTVLASFFEEPWLKPVATLTAEDQAWVLHQAGFRLRMLGRLAEAAEPTATSLAARIEHKVWREAANAAGNLSELQLHRGEVEDAVALARQGVEHADESGDEFLQLGLRTTHADAMHQAGRIDEAEVLFREAEAMQAARQPAYPLLYALQGYRYCDLLLGQGKADAVLERATQTLEWATNSEASPFSIGLEHLAMGRAGLQTGEVASAARHLKRAVVRLREAARQEYSPLGLLARARVHLATGDLDHARADLAASLTGCTRIGLRLLEADTWLGFTRLHLAIGDRDAAGKALDKARAMIEASGYDRRGPELAELEEQLAEG